MRNQLFIIALLFYGFWSCKKEITYDLLIVNGMIIDGGGGVAFNADVGIVGDRITFIGDAHRAKAKKTINAYRYIVCPGFIDPHTHAGQDLRDSIRKTNLNYLTQGVTSVFIGSDGGGRLDLAAARAGFQRQGIGTNVALWIGHNTIRRRIMGMRSDAPTTEELEQMKLLVGRGMQEGAIGLSSGLYYAPGSYSTTEEVVALAKVAAKYGGIYDAHIRDESTYSVGLVPAIEEMIQIAKQAQIPCHIAHIKCLGVDVWGQSDSIISLIDQARQQGMTITADQYPYDASGTSISGALVPRWVLADDPDPLPKFLDPSLRPRIIADMEENLRKRGGAHRLLLSAAKADSLVGNTLAELATRWQLSPVETAIKVLQLGGSSLASFNMQESDIQSFMKQRWTMTSSDGSTGHPRKYGAFSRKIELYVQKNKALTLEEMIQRSTRLTAQTFQLANRGEIKENYFADIIVFRPEEVKSKADFKNPTLMSEGMKYVIVNGQIAIQEGMATNALAGRVLTRKEGPKPGRK